MIIISRVIEIADKFIKVVRYGNRDIQEPEQYLPFGVDSKPLKDMLGAYSDTGADDEQVILGYLIQSKTKEGETRIYAKSKDGKELFYMYLKENGKLELGGDKDNLIRYKELESALDDLKTKINVELGKISSGIPLGSYTPTNVSIDISKAKIEEIRTT